MLDCKEIDALLMDWLYQELDPDQLAQISQHLDGCPQCAADASAFGRTREAFRTLEPLEPPAAVSAILLHEAARRIPAPAPPVLKWRRNRYAGVRGDPVGAPRGHAAEQEGGFWERLRAWLRPFAMHPGAAAIASLVLVAGVAGALWVRKGPDMAEHKRAAATSEAPPPADSAGALMPAPEAEPAPLDELAQPVEPAAEADGAERGYYAAELVDEDQQAQLALKGSAQAAASASDPMGPGAVDRKRPDAAKPEPARKLRFRSKPSGGKQAVSNHKLELGGPAANAVSGADQLVLDHEMGSRAGAGGATTKRSAPRGGRSPVTTTGAASGWADRDEPAASGTLTAQRAPMSAAELRASESRLARAAKSKRCQEAAAIANDIYDRNPDHYKKRVAGSKDVERCGRQVTDERKRRAVARKAPAADTSKNVGGGGKATAAPQKARAAPQQAESASQAD